MTAGAMLTTLLGALAMVLLSDHEVVEAAQASGLPEGVVNGPDVGDDAENQARLWLLTGIAVTARAPSCSTDSRTTSAGIERQLPPPSSPGSGTSGGRVVVDGDPLGALVAGGGMTRVLRVCLLRPHALGGARVARNYRAHRRIVRELSPVWPALIVPGHGALSAVRARRYGEVSWPGERNGCQNLVAPHKASPRWRGLRPVWRAWSGGDVATARGRPP